MSKFNVSCRIYKPELAFDIDAPQTVRILAESLNTSHLLSMDPS
jgi:hypothetical protein